MAYCITRTGMSMKANGSMIRLAARASILMQMGQVIMENGKMTNNMGLVLKSGQMGLFTKVIIARARRME